MLPEKRALLREIKQQGHYPTGGDPYILAFIQALLQTGKSEDSLIDLLIAAQKERNKGKHYLTKAHAVYLPMDIINYIMIFLEHKPDYPLTYTPSLLKPEGWHHLLRYILGKYRPLFQRFLLEKDVQQNIYQRGVTIPFFVHTLLHKTNLKVADLGCSANLVWSYIISRSRFDPVVDHTKWKRRKALLSSYATAPVQVEEMQGVDLHYPQKTEEGKKWLLSCRHPKEVKRECISKTERLLESLEGIARIIIHEEDFVHPHLPTNHFDIITMNNTLYQLPDHKRRKAIAKAEEFLKREDGLLIIQDHCRVEKAKDSQHVAFTDSRRNYVYRTCIGGPAVQKRFGKKWMEIFRFRTTRCLEVRPGSDFEAYMNGCFTA